MSETNGKPNIYQRIISVMKGVRYVQKEDRKVNNQYTFVSHDAVVAAIRPHLEEHGLAVIPTVLKSKQDGNRTVMMVRVTLVNSDNPEETVSTDSVGYGIDPQDKGPGKAYSYAYKNALLKLFVLETGDDPERDNIDYKANGGASKKPAATQAPAQNKPTNGGGNGEEQSASSEVEKELNKLAVELFGDVNKARRDAQKKGFTVLEDFVKAFRKHCVEAKTPGITLKKLSAIRSHKEAAINVMVQLPIE